MPVQKANLKKMRANTEDEPLKPVWRCCFLTWNIILTFLQMLQSMWGRSGPTVTDSAFHLRFIVTNEVDRQREFEGNFDPKVYLPYICLLNYEHHLHHLSALVAWLAFGPSR